VRSEYQAHHAEQRRRVAHWLKFMGVRSQQKRESLAVAILGSLHGIGLQWQIDPDHVDLDAAFLALATMVHSHLES
jgi:hypothetical protein